eukprot:jgi/Astpho2/5681/Aster-02921
MIPAAGVCASATTTRRMRMAAATCVNLRDCRSASDDLKPGALFRCSQVMSCADLTRLAVKSILDLRVMTRDCKKEARHFDNGLQEFAYDAAQPAREVIKKLKEGAMPPPKACKICSANFQETFNHEAHVFHADLVPTKVKAYIFYRMPRKTKLKTIFAPLWGISPEAVMAPAVADEAQLGYAKLYRLLLDHAQRDIAKALRVFTVPENFPVLVHCIHGKDRTGLIIMLIMLLCSIPAETIIMDYVQSEVRLKEGRDRKELEGVLAGYLVADQVLASTADTMRQTIEYVISSWGSAQGYVKDALNLSAEEISAIRVNVMVQAEPSGMT